MGRFTASAVAQNAAQMAVIAAIDRERRLLRLQDVAGQLNLSLRTVERLVAQGELVARRVSGSGPGRGSSLRVMQGDLDAYVDAVATSDSVCNPTDPPHTNSNRQPAA